MLAGRALMGVSSAGLLVMLTVILSDKVSLKENALQNALFGLISGMSFAVAPEIGGLVSLPIYVCRSPPGVTAVCSTPSRCRESVCHEFRNQASVEKSVVLIPAKLITAVINNRQFYAH